MYQGTTLLQWNLHVSCDSTDPQHRHVNPSHSQRLEAKGRKIHFAWLENFGHNVWRCKDVEKGRHATGQQQWRRQQTSCATSYIHSSRPLAHVGEKNPQKLTTRSTYTTKIRPFHILHPTPTALHHGKPTT